MYIMEIWWIELWFCSDYNMMASQSDLTKGENDFVMLEKKTVRSKIKTKPYSKQVEKWVEELQYLLVKRQKEEPQQ